MTDTLPLFTSGLPSEDIHHNGKIYRPYRKGMEDGFDTVKSGKRRPHGWSRYLFPGGHVVFDAESRACVDSIKELPPELKRINSAERITAINASQ